MTQSPPKPPSQSQKPVFRQPLTAMTEEERLQIKAYLSYGSFRAAAKACGFHRETISATWHRWRKTLSEEFFR